MVFAYPDPSDHGSPTVTVTVHTLLGGGCCTGGEVGGGVAGDVGGGVGGFGRSGGGVATGGSVGGGGGAGVGLSGGDGRNRPTGGSLYQGVRPMAASR